MRLRRETTRLVEIEGFERIGENAQVQGFECLLLRSGWRVPIWLDMFPMIMRRSESGKVNNERFTLQIFTE
jgi:hypothetical protein